MNCLVTGGAGFIGSHVVDRLVRDGHNVTVLDDFSAGKESNLIHHGNKITVVKKSICDDLTDVFKNGKFDTVFHLAAVPRVQFSLKYPRETHHANINGTLNLLHLSKEHGVKKFVFSSSSSVYGEQPTLPLHENMSPDPLSPYALQKLAGEQYCRLFSKVYGLPTVSLRYFNVYGPRQDPNGAYANLIPKFSKMIKAGERPTIHGDGNNERDFTYVEDVVDANIQAAMTNDPSIFGEAFNVGSGVKLSVNAVTKFILELHKSLITPIHGPSVIEPRATLADVSKAAKLLNWKPKVHFKDGMRKVVEYEAKQKH